MVTDISSNEVTSSIGESGVPYSAEFQSQIIRHIMNKYHVSQAEAREMALRAKRAGARQQGEYTRYLGRTRR